MDAYIYIYIYIWDMGRDVGMRVWVCFELEVVRIRVVVRDKIREGESKGWG
jgi:hypothetical protein